MKKLFCISLFLATLSTSTYGIVSSPSGWFSYQQKTIHPKDLHQDIRKYITANYNGAKILKAYEEGNNYVVEISIEEEKHTLRFDLEGKFVKKS